jgi:GT2 family glycosyltransferase
MSLPVTDIIVPVWNSPVETRSCLVNLVAYSPGARLILINNGCDRLTENLLEEFAESLDERALLISSRVNLGFVRAVNMGLARTEAGFVAVIRNTSLVTPGWLETILRLADECPEAGVIIPHFVHGAVKNGHVSLPPMGMTETPCGDFAAMLIRRKLYNLVGGFDEDMDGADWCLKDFSRRSLRAGFLTCIAAGSVVCRGADQTFGSQARREENLARSIAAYTGRWGEERSYLVHFPDSTDPAAVRHSFDVIMAGARQGHSFTVIAAPKAYAELARDECERRHLNIRLEKLPRLFAVGGVKRLTASLRAATPGLVMVAGGEGAPFPGGEGSIPFSELEQQISAAGAALYGTEVFREE